MSIGTVSGSGTGPLDYGSGTGPLDTDSRGPVVCETTTDKSKDTGPYLHVYWDNQFSPT